MSDLISREAAKDAFIDKGQASTRCKVGDFWELNRKEIWEVLDSLPSAESEALKDADKVAEYWHKKAEEYSDTLVKMANELISSKTEKWLAYPPDLGEDGISAYAIDPMIIRLVDSYTCKHGRWIDMDDHVMCSRCGATHDGVDRNFCPNCGARMEVDDGEIH